MSRTQLDFVNNSRKGRDTRKRRNPRNEVHREPPQESEEDRFYVIQKLLDKRVCEETGDEEYLVRWLNYNEDWDSWEPRRELEKNALDMVRNFDNQLEACDNDVHCLCKQPYRFDQGGMIQCFCCYTWFHFKCIEMNMLEANSCLRYYCRKCRQINPNFKILFKADQEFYLSQQLKD